MKQFPIFLKFEIYSCQLDRKLLQLAQVSH